VKNFSSMPVKKNWLKYFLRQIKTWAIRGIKLKSWQTRVVIGSDPSANYLLIY
jgi:hypothetical protein